MAKKLTAMLGGGVVAGITAYFLHSGGDTSPQNIENTSDWGTVYVQSAAPLGVVQKTKDDVNLTPDESPYTLVDANMDSDTQAWNDYFKNSDAIYQDLEQRLRIAKENGDLELEIYNEIISADPIIGLHTLIVYMQQNNIDDSFINTVADIIDIAENIDMRTLQDVQKILNDVKDMRSYTGVKAIDTVVMTSVFEEIVQSYYQDMFEEAGNDISSKHNYLNGGFTDFDVISMPDNAEQGTDFTAEQIRQEKIDTIYTLYQEGFDFSGYSELSAAINLSSQADSYLEILNNKISDFPNYRPENREKNAKDLDIEFGF